MPRTLLSWLVIALAAHASSAQPCEPDWLRVWRGGELNGPVRAFTTFDFGDGNGPSLVAMLVPSSYASTAGGWHPVLRWTQAGWDRVGGNELVVQSADTINFNLTNYTGRRGALAVYDPDGDGPAPPSLFFCGGFLVRQENMAYRRIARFDGERWVPTGFPLNSNNLRLFDMLVLDEDGAGPLPPVLYVAGTIGRPLIYKWDGSTWTDMLHWMTGFTFGDVYTLGEWDPDGDGPANPILFAGGSMRHNTVLSSGYLLQWDGQGWQPVGVGLPNRPGIVIGLTSYDADGSGPDTPKLVVVSLANEIEGRTTADITLWDGETWTNILTRHWGDLLWYTLNQHGPPFGRAWVHDDGQADQPSLFVSFPVSDPSVIASSMIWRWNGQSWTSVAQFDPQIGSSVNGLWHTSRFLLDAFTTFDFDGEGPTPPSLVVGGGFTTIPRPPVMPCNPDPNYPYVDVQTTNFAAVWDGQSWSGFDSGISIPFLLLGLPTNLAVFDPDANGPGPERLYVHGTFASAGGVSIPARECQFDPRQRDSFRNANARWSATTGWERAGLDPDIDPRTRPRRIVAVAEYDPDGEGPIAPASHVVGSFDRIDAAAVGPLARWNGTAWESFGNVQPANSTVRALRVFDPDGDGPGPALLIAAGNFASVWFGQSSADGAVAAWDGSAWSTLEFSADGAAVADLAVFDADGGGLARPGLIAAGDFVLATSLGLARDIAQFDGSRWTPLGGGAFTGQADTNLPVMVNSLAVFDDDGAGPIPPALYVGGTFLQWTDGVTTIPCRGIARWDGSNWSAISPNLGDPIPGTCTQSLTAPLINKLLVFDPDGPSGQVPPSLFAGGFFTVPGTTSQALARWDGSQWLPLGAGVSFTPYRICGTSAGVLDMAIFDDDGAGSNAPALFVAGWFFTAGADRSWGLAKWGCPTWESAPPPTPCRGDANGDRIVNFADVAAVLINWGLMYPGPPGTTGPGDANHDGAVGFADITTVLENWGLPCPP